MSLNKKAWLVYNQKQHDLLPHLLDCAQHLDAELTPVDLEKFVANAAEYLSQDNHVAAFLESFDLGRLLLCAQQHQVSVGLLPVHPKSKVCRLFGIRPTIEDAMPLALQSEAGTKIDLLMCNDEVIIWMVTLGNIPFIELRQIAYQESLLWQHIKTIPSGLKSFLQLQLKEVTVITAKKTLIKTKIAGAIIVENDIESLVKHFTDESAAITDSKLSALLVAPSSLMDYFGFILTALSTRPVISRAIGYIKTSGLTLESPEELDYYIDGQLRSSKRLQFSVIPKAVSVNVGKLSQPPLITPENNKDIIKIKNIPQGIEKLALIKYRLPLFSAAKEEDFKDVFVQLKGYVRPSSSYALWMMLSSMLATLGLFLNSAPVVIGAMLLAPLMGPLVSLAMGILRNDLKLSVNAIKIFAIGTILTLLVAAMTTLLMPFEQVTEEIRNRLHPNILDLGVAFVSGIAAAYAHARENILKSLPGVAIAVALVPPACVTGIGLGWWDWDIIKGASLLFVTNFIGITLAGILTFLCLGFASVIKINRELGVSLLLAAIVTIPLYQTFKNTIVYQHLENELIDQDFEVNGKKINLSDVTILPDEGKIKILAELHSAEMIQKDDITVLRDTLSEQLSEPVVLDVSIRLSI